MPSVVPSIQTTSPGDTTARVVTTAGIIAALYFGSEILVPIALAVLLSFAMAPAVKLLHKLGLGRGLPVAITVLFTFVLLAGLAGLIATQVRDLSSGFAQYESTVLRKIEAVRSLSNSAGLRKIEDAVATFSKAMRPAGNGTDKAPGDPAPAQSPVKPATATVQAPMPVEVVQPAMGPLEAMMLVASPLLHPLSMAFIVLIFVIFILLQREDLRNRAIRLFGASDLQKSTAAINDGAKRLSRYLLTQCAVNATTGVVVGCTLWLIGVPSPILLGILFAFARFVPYVGPVLGAALPLLLATAVDPGWSMVAWTLAMLVVVEVVIGQVVEPVAYGHNTGLSPIAIVLAATFWTVIWGPVGLLLSTPLTVCLVVLGRHVEHLSFLDVLLGDRPPLTPAETFYQRLLANDPVEIAEQARTCLREMSLTRYYDEVAMPGLLMAQSDATQGRLDLDHQTAMKATVLETIDDLQPEPDAAKDSDKATFLGFGKQAEGSKDVGAGDPAPEDLPEALKPDGSVLCIGARGPLDDAAAAMLAQVLVGHGIGALAENFVRLSKTELQTLDVSRVRLICLSALDGSRPAFLRFVMRRLHRHAPGIEILVGAWWRREGYGEMDAEIDDAIRNEKVATMADVVHFCFAKARRDPEADTDGVAAEPVALSVAS